MKADVPVGIHYRIPPQPPVAEDTHYVRAGAITIGVEYREVGADDLRKLYEETEFQAIYEAGADPTLSLVGVSLHVIDAADDREYLRFDCFDDEPHYHYIHPRAEGEELDNHVVWYDAVAHGPILPWALGQIRSRLPEMLVHAGAAELAQLVDPTTLEQAAAEVEKMAGEAIASQRQGSPA